MKLFIGLVVCLACIFAANAANILVVFPMPSRSHQILGEELTKALLKKGHHVTMASAYRVKEKLENFTGIYLDGLVEYKESKCLQNVVSTRLFHSSCLWQNKKINFKKSIFN